MQATEQKNNYHPTKRLQGIQPTLIRQFFERALPGSINFGLGEPDLPTPQFLREEGARVYFGRTKRLHITRRTSRSA